MTTEVEQKESTSLREKETSGTSLSHKAIKMKEDARSHFNELSEKYGVKHTFDFDEIYSFLVDQRLAKAERDNFRKNVMILEKKLLEYPGATSAKKVPDAYPLVHKFADGMYIRQLTVPARTMTITKIHSQTHPFFILKGDLIIYSERGWQKVHAPYSGITQAGTKRMIWHETEVVITTVHRTNEMELDKIEADIISEDFEELDNKLELAKLIESFKEGGAICHFGLQEQ